MKLKLSLLFVTLSMFVALALGVPRADAAPKGVELSQTTTLTAEVVAIDKKDRTLALLGPKGNVVALKVGEEAHNFDQVKVGDKVKVKYYEAVALYLGKHGQQPATDAGMVMARAPKGAQPGGYAVGAVDISAKVKGVDKENRLLTLMGPQGNMITTRVDKSVKGFDALKVGDTIHARHTKAIAISVEKP